MSRKSPAVGIGRRALSAALSLFTIIAMFVTPLASAQAAESPTIRSEFPDYAPGDQVTLIGEGWQAGEVVNVYVDDSLDKAWTHDSAPDDPVADANGYFEYSFGISANFVATYTVLATGRSGSTATTTFTDTPLDSNFQLEQWETDASPQWITGNLGSSNSTYKEGDAVPFRLTIPNNTPVSDNPVEFSVCRDYSNGTKRGYLYLDSFDKYQPAADAGGAITATTPLPNGLMSGVNVTFNSVTEVGGQGGCNAGQRETQISVNLSAATPRYVLWSGHLAKASDVKPNEGGAIVGAGNSAGSYPGSSLAMTIMDSSKTRSINPGSIIELPYITAQKFVDSGTATADQWCFTATGLGGFNQTKCVASGQSSVDFVGLNTGSYTVTESTVDGYEFVSGSGTNCTFNGSTATASVTAAAGGATNASCTFHNGVSVPDTGSLEVVKDLSPSSDPGRFNLFIKDSSTATVDSEPNAGDGGTTGPMYVAPGTYTVSETGGTTPATSLSKYTRSISCVDAGDNVVAWNTNGAPLDVSVGLGRRHRLHDHQHPSDRQARGRKGPRARAATRPVQPPDRRHDDANAANVGDGGSTGEETLNTGTHTVGETAGTGTDLADYHEVDRVQGRQRHRRGRGQRRRRQRRPAERHRRPTAPTSSARSPTPARPASSRCRRTSARPPTRACSTSRSTASPNRTRPTSVTAARPASRR